MRRSGVVWSLVLALLLPTATRAERHVFPAGETRSIVGPEAVARVLIGFDSVENLRDVLVISAYLEVPLPGIALAQDLDVCVYPLERPWRSTGASWTVPWNRAGGDLDETFFDETRIPAGRGTNTLRLDVTEVLRRITMRGVPSNGFLLSVPLRDGQGFTPAQRAALGTLEGAQLVVTTANALAARSDAATIR